MPFKMISIINQFLSDSFRLVALMFLMLAFPYLMFSQKTVTAQGSAQIEIPDNLSRNEVKNKIRELATIDALERAFGRVIIQGNSTYITNLQTGQKVETNTVFNTIANTSVKGEVLEIRNEKFTDIPGTIIIDGRKEPVTEMRCDIEVRAREIVTPPVNFTSFPLGCTDVKCRTTAFKNNDILYLFFTSPVSGYISVYLDDRNETQCLFPYSTMPLEFEGGVPVSADKKYILFSDKPEFNYFPEKNFTPDTYQLFTNSIQDMNRLFVIFSKSPLNKPSLSGVTELDDGYLLPKSLASEDFQKWMNTYRSHEKVNVQVEIIYITISK
jgi:hypothetical protein